MVVKKIQTRDYLRLFITKINKEAGVVFNSSKLNSVKQCEDYIFKLIKDLRINKQSDNKALLREIESLKEEIAILGNENKKLKSELKNKNLELESLEDFVFKEMKNIFEEIKKLKFKHYFFLILSILLLCSALFLVFSR